MLEQTEAADLFAFDNSYARLTDRFFARLPPTPVAAPSLVRLNEKLARHLRLDPAKLSSPQGLAVLAGNRVPELGEPLAMAYAGHQFGHFVSQLGDGRAILLGEVVDIDGVRRDIQLKGSGPTPFSRNGDGRAALGPVLREYIISEAMSALGVPTTRSLAVVTTGETVRREMPLPGAVLTRVASSHIRVGTFQYFAARGDVDAIRHLADHVIARHYPQAAEAANPYRALLDIVISRQAELVAKWLLVGFIHGVMNTDNMSIAGETIDYGPCAFMDAYDPATVYSSIDTVGRYAYGNQPRIAKWNLARLAETLLPLLAEDKDAAVEEAKEALGVFVDCFETAYAAGLRRKLGLLQPRSDDLALAQGLLERMAGNGADFTLTFRRLCEAAISDDGEAAVRSLFEDPSAFDEWGQRWRHRLAEDGGVTAKRQAAMRAVNPAFVPRNHLVEEALSAAVNNDNLAPFETLLTVLSRPFEDQPAFGRYATPPRPDQIVRQTFCGT
jgi:protein adenylyltransferase